MSPAAAAPGKPGPTRILLIGSSAAFRHDLARAVKASPRAELIWICRDIGDGAEKAAKLRPNIVVAEWEAREPGGRPDLERFRQGISGTCLILVGAARTLDLLRQEGVREDEALAFLTRDPPETESAGTTGLPDLLSGLLQRYEAKRASAPDGGTSGCPAPPARRKAGPGSRPEVVAMGASTGGPKALERVLSELPRNLPAAVLVVQHMQAGMTTFLAETLAGKVGLPVEEGRDGARVETGKIYLAPGGWHMKVVLDAEGEVRIALREDPPENFCRPSADYLFRSVAEVYAGRSLGVILTGIGNDGAEGLRAMKARGVKVIAQDEGTSVVYGMPKAAKEAGVVDMELPLERISAEIKSTLGI